jgi:hypothetical protein
VAGADGGDAGLRRCLSSALPKLMKETARLRCGALLRSHLARRNHSSGGRRLVQKARHCLIQREQYLRGEDHANFPRLHSGTKVFRR